MGRSRRHGGLLHVSVFRVDGGSDPVDAHRHLVGFPRRNLFPGGAGMAHVYSGGGRPGGRLHSAIPEEKDAGAGYGIHGGHVHRERADQVPGLRPESFSAAWSIASGAAIGKEGPIIQSSALIASAVGQRLHVSIPRLRLLVGCGAAAGFTTAFHAPFPAACS